MANACGVPFGACLIRVTRVDSNGNVIAGNNAYISDSPVSVALSPDNEAGDSFSVKNGCGCKIASRKFPDTFNFWNVTLTDAKLEPQLIAFLTGGATITDGADIVGAAFPSALECDEASPRTQFEWWSENGEGSGLNGTYPYWHFVIPSVAWTLGDNTFESGPASPVLNGTSQSNPNWGDGPYGDGPPDGEDITEGGFWATNDTLPTASCAAQAVTSTS